MSQITPEMLINYRRSMGGMSHVEQAPPPPPPSSGFERLTIYDAPDIALSQLIGGELTWSSLVDSFVSQESLSPEQRKGLYERTFGTGGNRITKTAFDIATNPWVWFYFLTTPVGFKALRSGKSLFDTKAEYSALTKRAFSWWDHLKSPLESHNDISKTLLAISADKSEGVRIAKEILIPVEEKIQKVMSEIILKNTGKKAEWVGQTWMDFNQYSKNSPEYQILREFQTILGARSSKAVGTERIVRVMDPKSMEEVEKTILDSAIETAPTRNIGVYYRDAETMRDIKTRYQKALDAGADPTAAEMQYELEMSEAWRQRTSNPEIDLGADVRLQEFRLARERQIESYKRARREVDQLKIRKDSRDDFNSKYEKMAQEQLDEMNKLPLEQRRIQTMDGRDINNDKELLEDLKLEAYWLNESEGYFEVASKITSNVKEVPIARVADMVAVDKAAAKFGGVLEEYQRAVKKANDTLFVRAIGKEDVYAKTGLIEIDDDKTARLISSLNREVSSNGAKGATTWEGKEALLNILGVERVEKAQSIAEAQNKFEFVRDELKKLIYNKSGFDSTYWMSRNMMTPAKIADGSVPIVQYDDMIQKKLFDLAPHASSTTFVNKLSPITERDVHFHQDFLDALEDYGMLTEEGVKHRQYVTKLATENKLSGANVKLAWNPSRYVESNDRHMHNMTQLRAFDTAPVSEVALIEDTRRTTRIIEEVKGRKTKHGINSEIGIEERLIDTPEYGPKTVKSLVYDVNKMSHGDMLDRYFQSLPSAQHQEKFRNIVVPNAIGNAGIEMLAVYNSHMATRETANRFANSIIGQGMEKYGGKWGKKFVGELRRIGDFSSDTRLNNVSDSVAKFFYVTHLGVNLGSMILNLTQPLVLAAMVENPLGVLKAYGKAAKEIGGYVSERVGQGFKTISDAEKAAMIRRHFKYGTELGIGPDMFSALDSHLAGVKGGAFDKVASGMLKGFEKTEWFARSVAGHMLEGAYVKAGRSLDDSVFKMDLQRFVLQTQFGQSDLNTPFVFQSGVMNNRLARQFLTFSLRSLTGAADIFPKLGESSYLPGLANTFFRGMGLSAMTYEAGKGLFGIDLSPGLYMASVTSIMGGQRMLDKGQSPYPVPPVISIPVDLIRGYANEDSQLLSSAIARLVPGGVAINRAMGFLPELPRHGVGGFPGSLQRQSVGWDEMQNGMVPVYDERGSLIDYKNPSSIVLKALGADMGAWQEQGQMDAWLLKNRPKITEMRHEYLRAEYANDFARAQEIRESFERKFKIPFTVTNQQRREFARSRVTSRTERILDMYGNQERAAFAAPVAAAGGVPMFDPSAVEVGGTASSRDELRPGGKEAIEEVVKRMQNVGPAATTQGAFTPFGGFR